MICKYIPNLYCPLGHFGTEELNVTSKKLYAILPFNSQNTEKLTRPLDPPLLFSVFPFCPKNVIEATEGV